MGGSSKNYDSYSRSQVHGKIADCHKMGSQATGQFVGQRKTSSGPRPIGSNPKK